MIYTMDGRVRFSEVDDEGYLRCDNFINYFQDCSTFQSEDLGIGIEWLSERNLAWVVCSWQIEITKYPKLGDKITIGTFAYDFKSFLGYRNYFMKDENGEIIAKATSIWVLLNLVTGKMSKADPTQIELYGKEEKLDMDYQSRKILVPEDLTECRELEIKSYNLDTNGHVNNGQFINIASGCIDGLKRPSKIRAEYKKQGHLGDIVVPFTDGKYVDLKNPEGETYCIIVLEQ